MGSHHNHSKKSGKFYTFKEIYSAFKFDSSFKNFAVS